MDKVYNTRYRLASYDVGPTRSIKPSSILRMTQETAGRHLEQDGLSFEYMRSRGIVFLLVKESVKMCAYPKCDDVINVGTWFRKCDGVVFIRDMLFTDESGSITAEVETRWVTADPRTHKIIRPSQFPFSMPPVPEKEVSISAKRIKMPENAEEAGDRDVRWSDIDCNAHMNNAVYADIMCDYFPGDIVGKKISEFQIDFSSEAVLGDKITILRSTDENGGYLIEGLCSGKKCFNAFAKLEK